MIPILAYVPGGDTLGPVTTKEVPPDPHAADELKARILDGLLDNQRALCQDEEHRLVAYVAGLGSGKTYCLCAWATLMALANPGTIGALFAPTGALVRDVIQQSLTDYWDSLGIQYQHRASPLPQYSLLLPSGVTTIYCRSMENWTRIIGLNLSFIGCDEIDTTKLSISRLAMQRFFARLRSGQRRQLGLFSTPEGFGLLYSMFVEEGDKEDRALFRGAHCG